MFAGKFYKNLVMQASIAQANNTPYPDFTTKVAVLLNLVKCWLLLFTNLYSHAVHLFNERIDQKWKIQICLQEMMKDSQGTWDVM